MARVINLWVVAGGDRHFGASYHSYYQGIEKQTELGFESSRSTTQSPCPDHLLGLGTLVFLDTLDNALRRPIPIR